MKETRYTYSLRFPPKVWRVITKRAKALFGSEESRARYLEDLALKEAKENEISKRA